jgi:hypothetical protein
VKLVLTIVGVGLLVGAGVFIFSFYFGVDPVETWAVRVSRRLYDLQKASEAVGTVMGSWGRGREISEEILDDEYARFTEALSAAAAVFREAPPKGDTSCEFFHRALTALVDFEEENLPVWAGVLDDMKASNPPSKEDVDSLKEVTVPLLRERGDLMKKAHFAQRQLADAKGFRIEDPKK